MVKNNFPKIILVNPQLPENIGLCARAMMNCGFSNLRLVNPRENTPNNISMRSSAHGSYILEKAKVYNSFEKSTEFKKLII